MPPLDMSGPLSKPPEESEKDCSDGAAGSESPRDQKGILRNIELSWLDGLAWRLGAHMTDGGQNFAKMNGGKSPKSGERE